MSKQRSISEHVTLINNEHEIQIGKTKPWGKISISLIQKDTIDMKGIFIRFRWQNAYNKDYATFIDIINRFHNTYTVQFTVNQPVKVEVLQKLESDLALTEEQKQIFLVSMADTNQSGCPDLCIQKVDPSNDSSINKVSESILLQIPDWTPRKYSLPI